MPRRRPSSRARRSSRPWRNSSRAFGRPTRAQEPTGDGRFVGLVSWSTGALCFGLYLATLAPSVGFIDSGELAAAAHTLGIPHPTGYPLFTLVAGAWARLPIGDGIYRLNLLAGVWSALSVVLVVRLAALLLARAGYAGPSALTAAALAGFAFGLSRTVWGNALGIEVYALHALLLTLALWSFFRSRAMHAGAAALAPATVGLAVGLAFSNHLTTVQVLPALGIGAALTLGVRGALAFSLNALPGLGLGLLPYLWLPWRAAGDPALNWGDPDSLVRFIDHVTAREYRGRFFMNFELVVDYAWYFASSLPGRFAWGGAALAGLGALTLRARDGAVGWVLAAAFATCAVVASGYAITDIDSYYILADLVIALLAAFGVVTARRVGPHGPPGVALAAVLALVAINGPKVSERDNHVVADYTHDMFDSLAPGALIVSDQWDQWVAASYYFQLVEELRPDVVVVDRRLLLRPWYLEQQITRRPGVFGGARAEVEALRAAVVDDDGRLRALLDALVSRLVATNIAQRPVYITVEIEESALPAYRQVPEGLALRLYPPAQVPSADIPVWDAFRFRPPPRRSRRIDEIENQYATLLLGRGVFLEQEGDMTGARRYYERARGYWSSPPIRAQLDQRLR